MKNRFMCLFAFVVAGSALYCLADQHEDKKPRVLFYSQSFGFRHSCVTRSLKGDIAHAEKVFREIAKKEGFEVDISQDFNDLKHDGQFEKYDAIVFYTTASPNISRGAFLKWLRSGKGYVGIHCATDSFYDWPEYANFINGQFSGHGPSDKEVTINVENPKHPATKMLGKEWVIADEIYHFKEGSFEKDKVQMLLSIDNEKTDLKPQKMHPDKYYPVSWTNTEGKGRVFYTSLGHREDVWTNPEYQQHLMGGLKWAMGLANDEGS